ncbi:hypothetical protein MLD38_026485 [Melastoma candidum]|uniref:Uncharacterized protein n=1 Tax=Melastoma candidum TaxID=119954 RepID=A0ACB9NZM7_9MYRT|nr:hypothetical protein MLD38_026485 [Melastoma candidum]
MGWIPCSGMSMPKGSRKSNNSADKKRQKKKLLTMVTMMMTPRDNKPRPLDRLCQTPEKLRSSSSLSVKDNSPNGGPEHIAAQTFKFHDLAVATRNFRADYLLGEGGFGRVYKGRLENNQAVAIKQLDRNGLQGNREFLVEVLMLSLLHHPNLVNLIGYCADGDQRLLVYEYMSLGSLEDHLHEASPGRKQMDWNTRMKIAAGAARGLEYLHDKATPPVIYRDLKCSNILLDEDYHPNFGVVLLEIITGRKAIDSSRAKGEQNLVAWARPLFKDRNKFMMMADPSLQGQYPPRGLYQALAVAAMCVQEQPNLRPVIADVVTALTYLSSQKYSSENHSSQSNHFAPCTPPRRKDSNRKLDSRAGDNKLKLAA